MIRLANEKDIQKILELFNSNLNLIGDNFRYDKNQITEYLINDNYRLFIYELNDKIIGVVSAELWKKAKWAYVGEIIVDKNYRRKGIGTKLLDYVEKEAKKINISSIFIFVDENNKEMKELMKKRDHKGGRKYIHYSKELK